VSPHDASTLCVVVVTDGGGVANAADCVSAMGFMLRLSAVARVLVPMPGTRPPWAEASPATMPQPALARDRSLPPRLEVLARACTSLVLTAVSAECGCSGRECTGVRRGRMKGRTLAPAWPRRWPTGRLVGEHQVTDLGAGSRGPTSLRCSASARTTSQPERAHGPEHRRS